MRTPQVTRTMTNTEVTVLALDVVSAEVQNITVTVPRTYKDNDKLLKATKQVAETDTLKVVHIVDSKEVETCYAMSEADFIKYAHVVDPVTRKAIEDEAQEIEE